MILKGEKNLVVKEKFIHLKTTCKTTYFCLADASVVDRLPYLNFHYKFLNGNLKIFAFITKIKLSI